MQCDQHVLNYIRKKGGLFPKLQLLIGDKVATVQEHYDTPGNDELAKMMREKAGI